MKTINEDPAEFFAGGGWGFLPVPGATGAEVCLTLEIWLSYCLIFVTEWLFGIRRGVCIRYKLRGRVFI